MGHSHHHAHHMVHHTMHVHIALHHLQVRFRGTIIQSVHHFHNHILLTFTHVLLAIKENFIHRIHERLHAFLFHETHGEVHLRWHHAIHGHFHHGIGHWSVHGHRVARKCAIHHFHEHIHHGMIGHFRATAFRHHICNHHHLVVAFSHGAHHNFIESTFLSMDYIHHGFHHHNSLHVLIHHHAHL